jgi:hypothetical protein
MCKEIRSNRKRLEKEKVETTRKGIEQLRTTQHKRTLHKTTQHKTTQHKTTQHKTNLGPYLPFFKISAIAIETA